ncbi:MAG: hypothetical protein H0X37_21290 [Herpetosiphonaceae bacterium]|nr:hypothetical protein [Herpetosiphonaceae bacterium]
MRDLTLSDLMTPGGGHGLLMDEGMSFEAAYDLIAERAAEPDFQAVLDLYGARPEGREILQLARAYWDKAGLPCPWDRVLDLGPVY